MAIFTITSNAKPIPLSAEGYPPCCGRTPEVLTWKRHTDDILVCCSNPECDLHENGVLEHRSGIKEKWERYRRKTDGA